MRPLKLVLVLILLVTSIFAAAGAWRVIKNPRNQAFLSWRSGSTSDRADLITVQRDTCPGASFVLPADGFIGLLYADPRGPYSAAAPHQGIDIFSNTDPGITAVYAAYGGYVSREPGWRSALIQRVPSDPLQPERTIWLYYAHMADRDGNSFIVDSFPPGTREVFVEQGTLLGYTGDFNGNSLRDVWVHLHFSIVRDDGHGRYLNELAIENTIDPSPYLNRGLNYNCGSLPSECTSNPGC